MDDEATLLQQFGRRRPFTVPEGYFEQLSWRMMQEAERPHTITLWVRFRKPLAVAAGVCLLIAVGVGYGLGSQSAEEQQLAQREVAPAKESASVSQNLVAQIQEANTPSTAPQDVATSAQVSQQTIHKAESHADAPDATVEHVDVLNAAADYPDVLNAAPDYPDVLDAAADYMMVDANDLYAMLEEE